MNSDTIARGMAGSARGDISKLSDVARTGSYDSLDDLPLFGVLDITISAGDTYSEPVILAKDSGEPIRNYCMAQLINTELVDDVVVEADNDSLPKLCCVYNNKTYIFLHSLATFDEDKTYKVVWQEIPNSVTPYASLLSEDSETLQDVDETI